MAFVSYERWALSRPFSPTANAWNVVPDLAVEVISPGDSAGDIPGKSREYLRGGVRLVWLIYPLSQEVHAYLPGAREIKVYFATDELDAGDILPGFKTPIAELFPPVEPPPAPQPDAAARRQSGSTSASRSISSSVV